MVHEKNQFLLCNYDDLETRVLHWKSTILMSRAPHQKGREKSITWDAFGSCFLTVLAGPSHLSRCMFGLNGLACVWGLSDGPIP
jgi:hypothetical protein